MPRFLFIDYSKSFKRKSHYCQMLHLPTTEDFNIILKEQWHWIQTPELWNRRTEVLKYSTFFIFSFPATSINRALDSTAHLLFRPVFWPNAHLPLVTKNAAYFLILLGRKWNCNNCALVLEEPACPACRENFLCCSAGGLCFSLKSDR